MNFSRDSPYYRQLYRNKVKTKLLSTKTNLLTIKKENIMSENVVRTTNWVAIVTIIANAVVELIKLIFS